LQGPRSGKRRWSELASKVKPRWESPDVGTGLPGSAKPKINKT